MRELQRWAATAVLVLGLWLASGLSAQAVPVFLNVTGIDNQHCCGGGLVCGVGFCQFVQIGVDQIHGSDGFCLKPTSGCPMLAIRLFELHQTCGPCSITGFYNPQLCTTTSKDGCCVAASGFFTGCSIPLDSIQFCDPSATAATTYCITLNNLTYTGTGRPRTLLLPPSNTVLDQNLGDSHQITYTINAAPPSGSTGAPEMDASSACTALFLMTFLLLGSRRRS